MTSNVTCQLWTVNEVSITYVERIVDQIIADTGKHVKT